MVRWILIAAVAMVPGCAGDSKTWTSANYTTAPERVAAFVKSMKSAPPAPILDAQFLEEALGIQSRVSPPGPTDYRSFARLTIDPKDYPAWRAALVVLPKVPEAVPGAPPGVTWWMTAADTAGAEFFQPEWLFGRIHGFVTATNDRRTLFVYTFTT